MSLSLLLGGDSYHQHMITAVTVKPPECLLHKFFQQPVWILGSICKILLLFLFFFDFFRVTPGRAQKLLLTMAQGIIWNAGDQIKNGCVQGKCLIDYTISPAMFVISQILGS